MKPELKAGQLLFSKAAKIRAENGTELTFVNADKKEYISVLLGAAPKNSPPTSAQLEQLLLSIGLVYLDRVRTIEGVATTKRIIGAICPGAEVEMS